MPAPSVSELRRTLNRQVLKAHAAKVIAVFQSWDLDGDGAISKREFRRAVQPLLNLPAGPEALDELFDLFDNDGSGCIGLKQIHEVLRRGQPLGPPPELLQARVAAPRESRAQVRYELRKMERDGRKNGVRSRARPWEGIKPQLEYDGGVPVQVPVEEQISRALRKQGAHVVEMFRMWDEDGDGEVSRDEFRKAMPVLGVHASRRAHAHACMWHAHAQACMCDAHARPALPPRLYLGRLTLPWSPAQATRRRVLRPMGPGRFGRALAQRARRRAERTAGR